MEMNFEAVETPPKPAATVVILRNTAGGMETFLLRRHGAAAVLGGAHVFPGGKVDPSDADAGMHARLDQAPAALAARLNEPATAVPDAAALFVAALREVVEECGVLFAHGADADTAVALSRLLRAQVPFESASAALSLRLDTSSLHPWSRWITPRVPTVTRARFDTRFFIAALPEGQEARHDDAESSDGNWLRPRAALQQYWDGAIEFAPPQIMTLAHLAQYTTVQQALASAQAQAPVLIEPAPFSDADGTRITCYPGDARHPIALRQMPGPTRLVFRNQRFEPPGGFEALFLTTDPAGARSAP
jgi:8-oxo-dGTP pyrophosphatase MutT (NUDIX family)